MAFLGKRSILFQFSLWLVVGLGIWVQWHYYPYLPPKVAIHFNALGEAGGWAPRIKFVLFNVGFLLGMATLFEVMIHYLPKLPVRAINLPWKKVWLRPEHRDEVMAYLMRYLLWIANLTVLFLFGLSYLMTLTNVYRTFRLGMTFWILFFLYIAATLLLTVELLLHFWRVPKES